MRSSTTLVGGVTVAILALGAVGAGGAAAAPGEAGKPRYTAGAEGGGDPYFPYAGNGGYDVQHYDLDLDYTPPAPSPAPLEGAARGHGDDRPGRHAGPRPVQPRPPRPRGARPERRRQAGDVHRPSGTGSRGGGGRVLAGPGRRGSRLGAHGRSRDRSSRRTVGTCEVVIEYGGTTGRPEDIEGALYGWVTTRDGALVANEPEGAMTWYPVSDHQTDKASYTFEITVPEGKTAVANGLPAREPVTADGSTTWYWDAPTRWPATWRPPRSGDLELRPTRHRRAGCRSSTAWTRTSRPRT